MRPCTCVPPQPSGNPRNKGICIACGRALPPSDIGPFFDRLADQWFKEGPPIEFTAFRVEAEARERRGWAGPHNPFNFYARDNKPEANEEWTDGANYLAWDSLQATRDGDGDGDIDLVLIGMYHAYKAYEATLHLRRRRRGAP